MIKLGIVDDHRVTRAGLREHFEACVDIRVSGEAGTLNEALQLASGGAVDVMLLDLQLGRSSSGIDTLRCVRQAAPDLAVVVLSGLPEDVYGPVAMQVGAFGFVGKEKRPDEIIAAVRNAAANVRTISAAVRERLVHSKAAAQPHMALSARELDLFICLAKGARLTSAAETLEVSIKTASTYRSRALAKMRMVSNQQMTKYAMAHGLIS